MATFFACIGTVVMSLVLNVFESVTKISLKVPRDTFPLLAAAATGFAGYLLFTHRRHKRQARQIHYRRRMLERGKIPRYKIVIKTDERGKPASQIEGFDENGNGFTINEHDRQSGANGKGKKKYSIAPDGS
jgi:hypothetical protein